MKPLRLAPIFALAACAPQSVGPAAAVPETAAWRSVASETDRSRFRNWRSAWVKALQQARAAGHSAQIEAEGALLDPDAALAEPAPPPGNYRCRTLKLGAKGSIGGLAWVAYPAFRCRVEAAEGGALGFAKLSGSQRPVGRIFPDTARRMVFLGTLQLGDEAGTLRYGHDEERDIIGLVERVGQGRWRIAFPSPHFESLLDVVELVPSR
jgi:hypothetical protein